MSQPRVSVVITTFNTGRYLPETLESVFAQSYPPVEVIVVDDGSTDDTAAVARAFGSRITLVERAHEGLAAARNAGLARVTGEYVAFLDSDDLWEPDALRIQVDVARRHPHSGMVVGDGVMFDGDTVISPRLLSGVVADRLDAAPDGELTGRLYHELLPGNPVCCPAQVLVPRWTVEAVGAVSSTACVPQGPQDYDYYLRIARRFPVTFHTAPIARWRFRSDSMSGPRSTRGVRHAWHGLILLERELRTCAPEDRAAIEHAMTQQARHGCLEAAHARLAYGTMPRAEAFATFVRLRPRDPVVAWTRVAFSLPAPVDRWVLAATRQARRAVHRARAGLARRRPTSTAR